MVMEITRNRINRIILEITRRRAGESAIGENMKIRKSQLRKLVREALLREDRDGYMVPRFETTEDMMLFIDELEPEDTTMHDVVDPETGEVWLEAGFTPLEAGLVEVEEEEEAVESDPDELDNYDWDAYEREREEERQKQDELYERMKDELAEMARISGEDWASDTLYQAENNPSMWDGSSGHYQQASSPKEYVLQFGQDAAGDVGMSVEYTMDTNEMVDWYRSLPRGESRNWDDRWRITQQGVKEMYADNFYDGVYRAMERVAE